MLSGGCKSVRQPPVGHGGGAAGSAAATGRLDHRGPAGARRTAGRRWLLADYIAGDTVVHSAYMVHAALDNTDLDGAIRLSADIRYQRASVPTDWRWQNDWHDRDGH